MTAAMVVERIRVRRRHAIVDSVRGLAVLLMLLDHLLFQVDPHSSLRVGAPWSITRLSLPLFMLAAASVWHHPPAGRMGRTRWRLVAAASAELVLLPVLGMPQPGIVLLILAVVLFADCWPRGTEPPWWLLGALGLVQGLYVPVGWGGYEPGLVLAWFALGRLAWLGQSYAAWETPAGAVWLEGVGRHALAWYLCHLALLVPLAVTYGVSPL